MDYVFLDSNALIKLYRTEKGAIWLKNYILGKQMVISELAFTESATTFARHFRNGLYTQQQAENLYDQIYQDRANFQIVSYGHDQRLERIVYLAFNISPINIRIRALDAIQLAAAEVAHADAFNETPPASFVFVTSDTKFIDAARAAGFVVENPEKY